MRARLALLSLLLVAAVVADEAEGDEPSDVITLTDENWESIAADKELLLVEFYAPWCGHCKALTPKYEAAATELKKDGISIAKYDADGQKAYGGKFGVSGFPTIKLLRMGSLAGEYDGARDTEGIVKYMREKAAQSVNKEITSLDALKKLTKPKFVTKTTLVGFFASKEGVDYKYWKAVVMQLADAGIEIYHVSAPEVLEAGGFYGSGASIQMFRPGAKPFKVTFRGTIFKATLQDWIAENAIPLVSEYSPETHKLFSLTGKHIVRVTTTNALSDKVDVKALGKLAEKYPSIHFTHSNAANYESDVEAHCGKAAVAGDAVCVLAQEGVPFKTRRMFGMDGDFTPANVEAFVEALLDKQLKTKVKSAAAPGGPPKAGEVAQIVGTNFEKLVADAARCRYFGNHALAPGSELRAPVKHSPATPGEDNRCIKAKVAHCGKHGQISQ